MYSCQPISTTIKLIWQNFNLCSHFSVYPPSSKSRDQEDMQKDIWDPLCSMFTFILLRFYCHVSEGWSNWTYYNGINSNIKNTDEMKLTVLNVLEIVTICTVHCRKYSRFKILKASKSCQVSFVLIGFLRIVWSKWLSASRSQIWDKASYMKKKYISV